MSLGYVNVNDRLPAVESSARYLVARLDESLRWVEEDAIWTDEAAKKKAVETFQQAREFYRDALERSQKRR